MAEASLDDIFSDDITLPAADGYLLGATLFLPRIGARHHAVLINSATAVPRKIYRGFAAYLARRGCAVLTYDYRGIGDSRQRAAHPKSRRAVAVPLANGPLFSTRQEGPRGRTMLAVVLYDCFNPANSQGGVMDEPTAAAAKAYWLEEQKRRREQAFLTGVAWMFIGGVLAVLFWFLAIDIGHEIGGGLPGLFVLVGFIVLWVWLLWRTMKSSMTKL